MKRTSLVLALLVSGVALAQWPDRGGRGTIAPTGFGGGGGGGGTPIEFDAGGFVSQTVRNMNLFVDPAGDDNNVCESAGALACKTIQGAINHIPKMVRHPVDVSIVAGTFTGAVLSGFAFDPISPLDGGFIRVRGTMQNATVATGSATGTVTSATTGSNQNFGTITDTGQSWTTNDLKGKLVLFTSGAVINTQRVIVSNTTTSFTIAGNFAPTPAVGVTYAIRSWGTQINTGVTGPASPSQSASTSSGIYVYGNAIDNTPGPMIEVSDIEVDATTMSNGVRASSYGGLTVNRIHAFSASNVAAPISVLNVSSFRANNIVAQQNATNGFQAISLGINSSSVSQGAGAAIIGSLIESATTTSSAISAAGFAVTVTTSQIALTNAAATSNSSCAINTGTTGNQQWNANNFTCASTASRGVAFLDNFSVNGQSSWGGSDYSITGCGTGIQIAGRVKVYVFGSSVINASTTGIDASLGANIAIASGTTVTGGTQDLMIDSNAFSMAQLSAQAPQSISNSNYATFIVRQ